jgi:hypothetical protein
MVMAIINGRRVDPNRIPNSGVYGQDVINELKLSPGRRPVFMKPGGFEQVDPNRRYSKRELLDKKGQGIKVEDIPDRTKGSGENPFAGRRSELSKRIIYEQVVDIAEHLYVGDRIDFDEKDSDWLIIKFFPLPNSWHHIARSTPLLIVFPKQYPEIPPIGCYMRETIPQSPNGHYYAAAYHAASMAPIEKHWKWYCVYVQPGAWKPAVVRRPGDWKRGDNLWTYLTLINESLASSE